MVDDAVHAPDPDFVSLASLLDGLHADTFKQALARILSTDIAELTFSEIFDGLPTEDFFREFNARMPGNPVFQLEHTSLCPGVTERIRAFRAAFDPLTLTFSPPTS